MFETITYSPLKDISSEDRLLDLYLSMPPSLRARRFADTLCAAEMAGVTRRTIQQWITMGAVEACLVGKRYRIDLESLRQI
ncbi:MAG TPA: helix-turn-helix domain-containing protein [Blastocatellia bacterium]